MQITVPDVKSFLGKSVARNPAHVETVAASAPVETPQPAIQDSSRSRRRFRLAWTWSTARKFQALAALLLAFLAGAAASVYIHSRHASGNSLQVSIATEMQMLSQRIANSAQQAAQGSALGFDRLKESRDQFIANQELLAGGGNKSGVYVPASSDDAQLLLREVAILWRTIQGDINLLMGQRQNLIALKQMEEAIEKAAPAISTLARDLTASAAEAGEPAKTVAVLRKLQADAGEFDVSNTMRVLSSERPDAAAAKQLSEATRRFQSTLSALAGETTDPAISPLTVATTKQKAAELSSLMTQFGTGVHTIASSLEALGLARQSGREIFTASEDLFKVPTQLVQSYQKEAGPLVYYIFAAILSAVLALACLVLLGKLFLDDARRRAAQSEEQNRRNQEAILRLLDEMGKVADGDLTAHAEVTEEITGAIADSVNYTIEELRRLVAGITQASAQVTTATNEARLVTSQLLQATEKQSSEIRGTGQSVLTMAQSINEVSAHAAQSANVAQGSLSAAEKGAHAVQNAIRGMNDIRDQIQETSKRIKRLGESSQEIGEIVQLITDITEQTNVLALNAAIQAASAGEAGRGFTVVAEEVQRLAERSGEATKHISTIVKSIQTDTQDAVQAMERSTQNVVGGARIADEAGQALHDIERISKELAGLIDSISTSARQQAEAATRVAASMQDILGVTELTSDGTKKTAASMVQLHTLANALKSSVAGFKLA